MKKWGVSARKVACQAFALGCLIFIQLVGARSARAESPRKVEGYELLGTLGYGILFRDLTTTNDRQVNPFGVTVGADFGYTFPFGLRLGTDAGYAFGRTMDYRRWTGEAITTHASSISWGGSIGYDLVLSSFRLRGAADGGFLFVLDQDRVAVWGYVGPKIAVTWQYKSVELGVQSRWMIWAGTIQVGLMAGTRF
jgi:hypothetical protein